jgi:sugar fermentation stimulation protein A
MRFSTVLNEAIFLKRYKRFFADILLPTSNEIVVAHLANTGSLKSCNVPNSPCLISSNDDPNRKLKYSLEAIKSNNTWVGVNTSWPNKLAKEAFELKTFRHWDGFDQIQTEVKINEHTRLDLVLWSSKENFTAKINQETLKTINQKSGLKFHFVEIKNVTLAENGTALFPDAQTERGQKHIKELMHLIDLGHTAELLFVVQREDCHQFKAAKEIDPLYAKLLDEAVSRGLLVSPFVARVCPNEILLTAKRLEFIF